MDQIVSHMQRIECVKVFRQKFRAIYAKDRQRGREKNYVRVQYEQSLKRQEQT